MLKKSILHITTWYPNKLDEQLGIFVQKHIEKGFVFSNNIVLAIIGCSSNEIQKIEITHSVENDNNVVRVYYPVNKLHKFLSLKTRNRAIKLGINKVNESKLEIDCVQCHIAEVSLWIAFKYFSNKKVFLIEHWSGFIDGRFEKIPKFIRKSLINRMNKCKHIFAVSDQLKKGILSKRVVVPVSIIPNVIENKSVKKETSNPFTFGVVADLVDEVKNISGIIKAYSIFKNQINDTKTKLVIIGDGADRIALQNLVDNLGLNSDIEFKGRVNNDEVLTLLPTFDILIVNSFKETFSMVTAEALLSGVAVLSTKCGGPEQFINHTFNGYLIDVNNEVALCQALNDSLKNENFKRYQSIAQEISSKIDVTNLSSMIIQKINSN